MRIDNFSANVAGFFLGTAPISWIILRSPSFGLNSYLLDRLFAFPLWPFLMIGSALVLIALRRGRFAIGLFAGSMLSLSFLWILIMAASAEA
jgi:hypothetical protein